MLIAVFPIVSIVLGVLLWVLSGNAVVKDIGKIMFACGWLVLTLSLARVTWRVGAVQPSVASISLVA